VWTTLKLVLTGLALVKLVQLVRAKREGCVRLEEAEEEAQQLPAPVTQEKA